MINDAYPAFYWSSPLKMTKIEALDQRNGIGGVVTNVLGGVNDSFVSMYFQGSVYEGEIDFIINIYAESFGPNHYITGNVTENSVLLST